MLKKMIENQPKPALHWLSTCKIVKTFGLKRKILQASGRKYLRNKTSLHAPFCKYAGKQSAVYFPFPAPDAIYTYKPRFGF
jgi:hypothetical protein